MSQSLSIEEKCLEMIKYGYVVLKQFPRYEKHGLAAEIRATMWRTHRLIVTALKRYHKKTTLTDLDVELTLLKRQARLSKELGHIDSRRYQIWITMMVEIGKMLGGWIKHVNSNKPVKAAAL